MRRHRHDQPTTRRRAAVTAALVAAALLAPGPGALADEELPVRERSVATAVPPPSGPGDLAVPPPSPPSNDLPGNARKLGTAAEIDLAGQTNTHATAEVSPAFGCVPTHRTVWYRWTAPADGVVQFRALQKEVGDDHTIAAFAGGPGLHSPLSLACNDDTTGAGGANPLDPSITFAVTRGGVYRVAVGAVNEFSAGPFDLRVRFVHVTIAPAGAPEGASGGASTLPITVELSSPALSPMEVHVVDAGTGTAQPGIDYQPFPTAVAKFGTGVTSATGLVPLIGNDDSQPDRTVHVESSHAVVYGSTPANPSGAAQFDPGAGAVLTIVDDD
jgi:hypothetical protein